MATGRKTHVTGYVNKDGKLVKIKAKMDVSKRIAQGKSKRVKVVRRTP